MRNVFIFILISIFLVGCQTTPKVKEEPKEGGEMEKSFLQNKMENIIVDKWKIIEIKENEYPKEFPNRGPSGYRIAIEGKPETVTLRVEGFDGKDDVTYKEILFTPKYHIWFMPIKYKETFSKDKDFFLFKESPLQRHYPFRHPYIIGENQDIIIFYILLEGTQISPLKDTPLLKQRIIENFNLQRFSSE